MTVRFKPLKYKHQLEALEIKNRLNGKGAASQKIITDYVASLLESWDYLDVETGEPVALGNFGELGLSQFNEVMDIFNQSIDLMGQAVEIPKSNGSGSQSGLTESKPAKGRRRSRQIG